jgi:hypothetical protein
MIDYPQAPDAHRSAQSLAVCAAHRYGRLRAFPVKPSKILSITPISNSDPPSVHIEVQCSLCDEVDSLVVNLNQPGDLSWLRRHDFQWSSPPMEIRLDYTASSIMLQLDFDPAPTEVRIHRCGYLSRCKKPRCQERATLIAEKVDGAGRHVRQLELCERHCEIVIERSVLADLRLAIDATNSVPSPLTVDSSDRSADLAIFRPRDEQCSERR